MQFCAHLGYQFNEYNGIDRLRHAAIAGFNAVEWPAIYDYDIDELVAITQELGLSWAQITLPFGSTSRGEKGLAAIPGRESEFEFGLHQAVKYATALGAKLIHPMSGVGISLSDVNVMAVYMRNLQHAIHEAHQNGLQVVIEVISQATVPGYALSTYEDAGHILEHFPDVLLLVDAYHAQVLTGDPVAVVQRWAGRIGHVQVADYPGRNEPGTGQLDFVAFIHALRESGYNGFLGCEYKPMGHTLDGLRYLENLKVYL